MYKIILFILIVNTIYSQNQFDVIIATGQNNISGISHPAIEVGDSIYAFIKTDYRYSYGFPTSLVKLNKQGIILSNNLYLDTLNPFRIFDALKEKKEVLICGIRILRDSSSRIIMYGELNSNMDTIWTRTIKGNNNHPGVYKITRLNNSNIAMVGDDGQISSTGGTYQKGDSAIFILTDSIGNIIKYIHFPKKDSASLEGLDYVMQSRSGDIYCVGEVQIGTLYNKGLIIKLSKYGDVIWRKDIEQFKYGYWLGYIKELTNGNILLVGSKYIPFYADNTQTWTCAIELDSSGIKKSEKIFYNNLGSNNNKCITDNNGNIICSGAIIHDDTTSALGYLIKLSPTGDSIWKREFTHGWKDRDEVFTNIAIADDGGYYLTGYNWAQGDNSSKAWVVKVDSNGCVVPGCNTAVNVEPEEFNVLFHTYPNPVKDQWRVYLNDESMENRSYLLSIHNINGQEVLKQSLHGMRSEIDLKELPSGLYIYSIQWKGRLIQRGKLIRQ
ncbi:MAG: T9SS type A sorting domain-containing protein [Saprospiraceae bacterium]